MPAFFSKEQAGEKPMLAGKEKTHRQRNRQTDRQNVPSLPRTSYLFILPLLISSINVWKGRQGPKPWAYRAYRAPSIILCPCTVTLTSGQSGGLTEYHVFAAASLSQVLSGCSIAGSAPQHVTSTNTKQESSNKG